MVGAVLGIVFNVLHPRGAGVAVTDELGLAAGSTIWIFDHFMLVWALLFALVGLVVIGLSFEREPGRSWGRVALASALASGAVILAAVFMDGIATKAAAVQWAATQSPEALASGTAVAMLVLAMFTAIMFTFFGLTPVLFGVAVLKSAEYPRWLGYLAVGAGALGLITGSIQFMNGISPLTANILFPISSLAFTVWALVMGWTLWKRSEAVATTTQEAIA
jgi:hypothetical protein